MWRFKIHLSCFDIEVIALFRKGYQTLIVVIMKYCFEAEKQQNVEIDS